MKKSSLRMYTMIKPLGSGNFGKVKCKLYAVARHTPSGTEVALKVISKRSLVDKQHRSSLEREVSALSTLHHPNILAFFEFLQTPQQYILITEYVTGGDLCTLLERKGRLSESHANKLFQQLLAALEHAHSQSVIHRDIKAENVLLTEDGTLKLADFGLSAIAKDGQFMRTPCGSPNYAAPEILQEQAYAGPCVDVWSSGVLLFALAAGRLPFDENSLPALFAKIKSGTCTYPCHFSPGLVDLLSRMLTTDPVARITVSQAKNHPWVLQEPKLYTPVGLTDTEFKSPARIKAFLDSPQCKVLDLEAVEKDELESRDSLAAAAYRMFLNKERLYSAGGHSPLFKESGCNEHWEVSTTASSQLGEVLSQINPSNWAHGFKTAAPPSEVMKKLAEGMRQLGFQWGARGECTRADMSVFFSFFREKSSLVVDVQMARGKTMQWLDLCGSISRLIPK